MVNEIAGRESRLRCLSGRSACSPRRRSPAETITVEGNRRVDAETVRSYFHASTDGQYDAAARDAALKALIATGLFDKVTIDRAGNGLVVHVTEAKVLGRVAFEGNKKVKDADLTAAVQSKARGPLQRATVQADVNRIVEAYRRVGRDDVSVVPEIIDRGSDRVDLVFTITEGKKTTVQKINFVGNHAFSNRQLNAVIKTSASSVLSFFTGGDVYDPDRINEDREQIRLYYRSHGYADASVPDAHAEYDPATKGFAVTFTIDEGQPYRFGKIDVACNVPGLDPQKLRSRVLVKDGASFDGGALDKTTDALAIEMAKLGYPFAHATPRMARDAIAQRVDVTFVVEEGQRTYVERIEIHGNSRTRDYVIRREFDFGEGDPYNKTLIDRAERRLKNLNYFKTVKISTRPGSTPDRVILDVEAVDQSTGDFFISGGYSTTDGWLAEVKVGDRNFYGTGNAVQATVSYGQYAQGGDLSFVNPALFGNHVSGGIDLFGRQTFASPYQSYGSNTYGAHLHARHADHRADHRAVALLALRPERHARSERLERDGVAADAAGRGRRPAAGLGGRRHRHLQHARQQQAADQRHQLAAPPGYRGPRRRREIPAHHRGRALLQVARRRPRRHGARARRLHHRLGRPGRAADEQLLRRPHHGARLCAQRLWPARSHPRLDHG